MSAATQSAERTSIPTRGFSFHVGLQLLASALLVVVGGILIYLVQTLHGHPLPIAGLAVPIALIVVVAIFIPLPTILRRPACVGLSSFGVEIQYPLKRVHVEWHDVMRVRAVSHGVVVFRTLSDTQNRRTGAFWISVDQARAILNDPRCPGVYMPENLRRAIFQT